MKDLALYDESCSLCQRSKKWMMSLDWFNQVAWVSLQDYEQESNCFPFNKKDLRKELHLITSNGRVLKGFYAIRKMMLQCPLLVIPGVICYLPFVNLVGNRVYRWVAENRHILFRQSCDDEKCSF